MVNSALAAEGSFLPPFIYREIPKKPKGYDLGGVFQYGRFLLRSWMQRQEINVFQYREKLHDLRQRHQIILVFQNRDFFAAAHQKNRILQNGVFLICEKKEKKKAGLLRLLLLSILLRLR